MEKIIERGRIRRNFKNIRMGPQKAEAVKQKQRSYAHKRILCSMLQLQIN